jgi:hypothetical protein
VSWSFALSIAAWSALIVPSFWRTSASCVSTCCFAIESWQQRSIALEVDLRVLEQRLVFRHLSLRLLELDLERARIDLGQQIACLDELALGKRDPHELSVHARLDGHDARGRDRAQRVHVDIDGTLPDGRGDHRQRAGRRIGPPAAPGAPVACGSAAGRLVGTTPPRQRGKDDDGGRPRPHPARGGAQSCFLSHGRDHGVRARFVGRHRGRKIP